MIQLTDIIYCEYIMPRCFSKCRGVKEEECKEPCSFIAKKYCRLSSEYKLEPPGCEIVTKKVPLKKTKPVPVLKSVRTKRVIVPKTRIQTKSLTKMTKPLKTVTKSKTKAPITSQVTENKPRNTVLPSRSLKKYTDEYSPKTLKAFMKSAKTIQSFMKKTEGKRKALFLQSICSDSGVCLTFGKEKDKIMDFFRFNDFTYATFPTKTIGEVSGNGFVKQIRYQREKYEAYAVLKSAKNVISDNLAYEYLVGKYLNDKSKRFPVFLETYGLFTYKDSIERQKHLTKHSLTSQLTPLDPNDIRNVCFKTSTECILIQHLKNVKTLHKMKLSLSFFIFESPYIFYHIYFALHHLRKEYTHYDLHTSNVLLFEPVKGKYLEYHYHLPNETIVFHSKYIVKIIDYGRGFFPGAPEYYEKLMAVPECKKGNYLIEAFAYLRKERTSDDIKYFVNNYYKNESHDLKLFRGYGTSLEHDKFKEQILPLKKSRMGTYIELFNKIVYDNVKYPHLKQYGTKEDLSHDDKIRNVTDVEEQLRKWITKEENILSNKKQFKPVNKLGEFHIYSDGKDMEYKPV